ncbi:MAG: hypothetical protein EA001_00695 [Oscillatoriales cyanobacterium]|nr:MAG: hypothetical protein EA001_00695 [Oscillatoriales cyanobacterium]
MFWRLGAALSRCMKQSRWTGLGSAVISPGTLFQRDGIVGSKGLQLLVATMGATEINHFNWFLGNDDTPSHPRDK